jgi:sirohydrochlorin ferrochelatase
MELTFRLARAKNVLLLREDPMRTALIILGHGSRQEDAAGHLAALAAEVRSRGRYAAVEHAFLQYASPSLSSAVARCVEQGAERVVVVPFFVLPGSHVVRDIPALVEQLRKRHPAVRFSVTGHVGGHPLMETIVEELAEKE